MMIIKKRKKTRTKFDPDSTPPERRKPTTQTTLIAAIILSTISILFLGVGMGLKLAYGPSLYYPDKNYWLAVFGLILIAISIPIGVTSVCLINALCRIKKYIDYQMVRKRELESKVADTYVAPILDAKSPLEFLYK